MWYAAHDLIPPHRAAQLTTELHHHHALLIAHLPALVAAFDTPDLTGPIFSADYIRAWQDHAGRADATFTAGTPIRR
ncbi:hypothetical protein [Nocardia acidivorans]|uniref:hypothetical protein n=1 Tax=Nocardia acidivorans TaxID=404580 RepID=UPI00082E2BC1|nr:hypothetical protein [Nocardia acidivorans]